MVAIPIATSLAVRESAVALANHAVLVARKSKFTKGKKKVKISGGALAGIIIAIIVIIIVAIIIFLIYKRMQKKKANKALDGQAANDAQYAPYSMQQQQFYPQQGVPPVEPNSRPY